MDPCTPAGNQDFLCQHDAQIVWAVQSVVHVQPGEFLPHTTTQLSLPAHLGGAGLSNQERLSGIAYASSVAISSGAMFQRLSRRRFVGWRTNPQQFRELAVISNACEYWSSAVNEVCTLDPSKQTSFTELPRRGSLIPPTAVGAVGGSDPAPVDDGGGRGAGNSGVIAGKGAEGGEGGAPPPGGGGESGDAGAAGKGGAASGAGGNGRR